VADTRAGSLREERGRRKSESQRGQRRLTLSRRPACSTTSDRRSAPHAATHHVGSVDAPTEAPWRSIARSLTTKDARKLLWHFGNAEAGDAFIVAMDNPLMAPASCHESAHWNCLRSLGNTRVTMKWLRTISLSHRTRESSDHFWKGGRRKSHCADAVVTTSRPKPEPREKPIRQKEGPELNQNDALGPQSR